MKKEVKNDNFITPKQISDIYGISEAQVKEIMDRICDKFVKYYSDKFGELNNIKAKIIYFSKMTCKKPHSELKHKRPEEVFLCRQNSNPLMRCRCFYRYRRRQRYSKCQTSFSTITAKKIQPSL